MRDENKILRRRPFKANIYIRLYKLCMFARMRNQDKHLVYTNWKMSMKVANLAIREMPSTSKARALSLIRQCLNKKSKKQPFDWRNCHTAGCKGDLTKLLIISE